MRKYLRLRQRKLEKSKVAGERVNILLAKARADPEGKYSRRYVGLARKLARSGRLRVAELECCCPACQRYLALGVNCKIRVLRGKPVVLCKCGQKLNFLSVPVNKKE